MNDSVYICPEDKSALVFNDLAPLKFCDNPNCTRCLKLRAGQVLNENSGKLKDQQQ